MPISGPESFKDVTGGDKAVAGLYAYAQLDPLIELACHVAADFFARPQLYVSLGDEDMPARLARLRSRVGHSEWYPSADQRRAMYEPVFGMGSGDSDFERLRDGLLAAAAAFAEWSQATGIPMLRARVRTAHRPLREYLRGVSGATVDWSRKRALPAIADNEAYPVLRDRDLIAVFGLTGTPAREWPYQEDANGDKVVEEIGRQLAGPEHRLTREGFSALQRVALRGAEALAAVLAFDEGQGDDRLDELITACYTWHAALEARHHTPAASVARRELGHVLP
ncbi:hypothetical protein FE374_14325 [Georgenia yuyongxinii]|uniref:Uncharacterized protein n=1 Tax=Georgenia yuyongxinii TaxID=2589797 RepID=A0A5B8C8C9_9MICO|nr:hypothetical protein [Georgenia yuyongxinii]QDC25625.1 hypothetical protein FE374_14325 [Georgenia yuyongxinii]